GRPRPTAHRSRGGRQPAAAAGELPHPLPEVQLDFMLLGLGPDAHIASPFPGKPQLDVENRRATSGPAGLDPWVDRVTMTMPTILSAGRLVLLVTGADKAQAVERAFGGEITRDAPATLLRLAPVPPPLHADPAPAPAATPPT